MSSPSRERTDLSTMIRHRDQVPVSTMITMCCEVLGKDRVV